MLLDSSHTSGQQEAQSFHHQTQVSHDADPEDLDDSYQSDQTAEPEKTMLRSPPKTMTKPGNWCIKNDTNLVNLSQTKRGVWVDWKCEDLHKTTSMSCKALCSKYVQLLVIYPKKSMSTVVTNGKAQSNHHMNQITCQCPNVDFVYVN